MIQTSALTFQYTNDKEVFNFPDLLLEHEENLLILGKSGVGKTTLLHLLAGLLRPLSGELMIESQKLNSLSAARLDKFRGQYIGLVFQNNHAIPSLTVRENLEARLYFSNKPIDQNRISELLSQLDLGDCKDKKVRQLSVGQLQRLAIALAVVHKPSVILADEPTSSLDDGNCEKVIALLQAQAAQAKANLIIITHDQRVKPYFKNSLNL